jgi:hypothetical protein
LLFCFDQQVCEVVTEADKPFQGSFPLTPDSQLRRWQKVSD